MKLILATKNEGKLKELKELGSDAPWLELLLAPREFDPEETGSTFLENAEIKARAAALLTGEHSVADDSGLVVEALNGRPGVYSSRYCEGSAGFGRRKLLVEMAEVPESHRQAAFVCAMVVCDREGVVLFSTQCRLPGRIGFEERGDQGFGFDPIFYLIDQDKTVAQLEASAKNELSHRGQAWRQVIAFLNAARTRTDTCCQ